MRVVDRIVPYEIGQTFNLYPFGDFHKGGAHHNRERLRADVARIAADPRGIWFGTGDNGECIVPGDKRFRAHGIAPKYLTHLEDYPRLVTDELAEDLAPIADKCAGIATGNHDDKLAATHYFDVTRALCDRLNVPYLGNRAFVRLRFERPNHKRVYVVHVSHGTGGGGSASAPALCLERFMGRFEADVTFIGHFHRPGLVRQQLVSTPRRGGPQVVTPQRVGIAATAYLDSYTNKVDGYVESIGLASHDQVLAWVELDPESGKMDVHQ